MTQIEKPDETFFRRLVEQAGEGIWVIDAQERTIYANLRMAEMLGVSIAQMLHGSMYDFMSEQQHEQAERNVARRRSGVSESHDFAFRRGDGSTFWAELTCWPRYDDQGNYIGAIAFVSDIARRREAEQRLLERERAYWEVFERSHAVKLMIDPESGRILDGNAAARNYYGYSLAELQQLRIGDINILPPEAIAAEMARATQEERNYFCFRHRLKNGEVRDVEVHSNPIRLDGRTLLYSIVHDIGRQTDAEHRLRLMQFTVDQASQSVIWIDQQGLLRYANRAAGMLANTSVERMIGQPIWKYADRLSPEQWADLWQKASRQGSLVLPAMRWSANVNRPVLEVDGHMLRYGSEEYVVMYSRDVTTRVQSEGLLQLQHDMLAAIAGEKNLSALLDQLARGVEALAPELLCSVLLLHDDMLYIGAAPSLPEPFRQQCNGISCGPSSGSCGTAAYLGQVVEVHDIEHDPLWVNFKQLALPHGLRACWSTPVKGNDGKVLGTFALYYRQTQSPSDFHREIVDAAVRLAGIAIEQRQSEARIHSLAFYDALTHLPNRALLADRAAVALAQAEREQQPLALLFLDLDRFKTINDSLGHTVGDRFLKTVAERLAAVLRESDTFSRIGGDEFVLLLPDCDETGAAAVADKLLAACGQPINLDGMNLNATASIGIAMYPADTKDYEGLLKSADTAMYEAKEAGRNAYRFYRREMNQAAAERLEIESALREALLLGQFCLFYQPQVQISSGQLYGMEALVRWRHPQWGMVSPARFIPIAEECGLIGDLGSWVLEEACRQLAQWRSERLDIPCVSVNLSAHQFRQTDLVQLAQQMLERYQLPPQCLTLEITEGLMMRDDKGTLEALGHLDRLGFKLAVDDFGTGYSSLSYLKRFPVRELKLDQSFVRDLGEDADDRALASAVIRIGQSLRLTVVAEGVETAEQLAFLQAEGCDVAQGYYFAKPLPPEELPSWLKLRLQ